MKTEQSRRASRGAAAIAVGAVVLSGCALLHEHTDLRQDDVIVIGGGPTEVITAAARRERAAAPAAPETAEAPREAPAPRARPERAPTPTARPEQIAAMALATEAAAEDAAALAVAAAPRAPAAASAAASSFHPMTIASIAASLRSRRAKGEPTEQELMAAQPAPRSDAPPTPLQFRDLFHAGKPSPRAHDLSREGAAVILSGFFAEQPPGGSPFNVMVGAPTEKCPYCSTSDDDEKLPFILIYAADGGAPGQEAQRYSTRMRLRVVGRVEAGLAYDEFYGFPNELRVVDAEIMEDPHAVRLGQRPMASSLRRAGAALGRPAVAIEIDE